MSFCTAINCMDGRIQLPVIEFLMKRFNVAFVDGITEPGPNLILATKTRPDLVESIFERIKISIEHHKSVGIAVIGHYDCAGNPANKDQQEEHTKEAMKLIGKQYSNIEIIGLWVDENWQVNELEL